MWKLSVAAQVASALSFLHAQFEVAAVAHIDVDSVLVVEEQPPLVRLTNHGIKFMLFLSKSVQLSHERWARRGSPGGSSDLLDVARASPGGGFTLAGFGHLGLRSSAPATRRRPPLRGSVDREAVPTHRRSLQAEFSPQGSILSTVVARSSLLAGRRRLGCGDPAMRESPRRLSPSLPFSPHPPRGSARPSRAPSTLPFDRRLH